MPQYGTGKRINAGDIISQRELMSISGQSVRIPNPESFIHLQFRRFAGCPVCNLHLHSFVQRRHAIEDANIREVILFHSTEADLQAHASDFPFAIVADPKKLIYKEFGVETSMRSLLNPRAWLPIVQSVFRSLYEVLFLRKPLPSLNPKGGRYGLPADFLIANDGTVLACKYGTHVYDQWSVDELLEFVGEITQKTGTPII